MERFIEFNQSTWFEPYICLHISAPNDFEKDLFKLINHAVFGKTIGIIRKHTDIKLATIHELYVRLIMKPNFKSQIRFMDNFFALEMENVRVVMNKPVYLYQVILNLSKILMYKSHYDYSLPRYEDRIRLCYMDTDSFLYRINMKDWYNDIAPDVDIWFDTSNYDNDRPLPTGKKTTRKLLG